MPRGDATAQSHESINVAGVCGLNDAEARNWNSAVDVNLAVKTQTSSLSATSANMQYNHEPKLRVLTRSTACEPTLPLGRLERCPPKDCCTPRLHADAHHCDSSRLVALNTTEEPTLNEAMFDTMGALQP